jgi:AraC-like DNA-binding protein
MPSTCAFLRWPLRYLPACASGGSFPMHVPGCNIAYPHTTIALHLHDYPGMVWIGSRRYHLEPGDITLSPGGKITSRYELKSSGHHLCLHIERPEGPSASGGPGYLLPGFARAASRANRKRTPTIRLPLHLRLGPAVAEARERIWRVVDHVRQAGGRENSPAACASSAALQELLLWLHLQSVRRAGPRRSSLVESAMQKLEQAIEASLTKPLLLGDLAANVGLSTDYVARMFAKRYGMRLQRYLLLRRIELARHLLVSSDHNISAIGRQVGLPDPQYFNKQFRRVAGLSPLAYRRQNAAG